MERENNSQKEYVYATAANGMTVRVPIEDYASWSEAQIRILQGKKDGLDTQETNKLKALMTGEEKADFENVYTASKQTQKNNSVINTITNKRIAAVISIVLCIAMYLCFFAAFQTKRDTYICYTTKTGECFHAADCKYLNTAYETTVYEASQKYRVCKYCNPCVDKYKTTITTYNYVAPAIISIPISAGIFFLLGFKKKRNETY